MKGRLVGRRKFLSTTAVAALGCVLEETRGEILTANTGPEGTVAISDLDINLTRQGWDRPQRNRRSDGKPLTIGKREFKSGLGTVADSVLLVDLKGSAKKFSSWVGPDAVGGSLACLRFYVVVDGRIAAETSALSGGSSPVHLSVNLRGARTMLLIVDAAGGRTWNNYADWGDAVITLEPDATAMPEARRYIPDMTVPELARWHSAHPKIHGPAAVGTTPGKPFLFKIPATGSGSLTFSAKGLPEGLSLESSGVLRGSVKEAGTYSVEVVARNTLGTAQRTLEIRAGDRLLSQSPPMGWSSWNALGSDIDQEMIKQQAEALVSSGLAAMGYNFINVDAGWPGPRDAQGRIRPNEKRFPDIKALIAYIHSLGLKFGIYSSPGPKTCGGFTGSYGHEIQDIETFADWGVDYFKYDWCSYQRCLPAHPNTQDYIEPYAVMGQAIGLVPRDIVFSLCQYGMKNCWEWAAGAQVHGNLWRISDDLIDFWGSVCVNGFYTDRDLYPYAGPGHWNDPDMLVVGTVDFTNASLGFPGKPEPSRLTPIEQQTHVTLWSLLAAPLIIGCDLKKLDDFTLNLLANPEVIAVDQDPLGRQAQCVKDINGLQIWARLLADGTTAVGIFNLSPVERSSFVKWADLATDSSLPAVPSGKQPVRDLWRCSNLPACEGMKVRVPSHGSVYLKVGHVRQHRSVT